MTDILAPQINFFTISSKVFLLYPDFSYRLTQILSTYLSRNILEEYFRFKKEHTPNTFIFKINTIISKLLSFVSLSFDRKNIRSESSRTVHTRNIYIYIYICHLQKLIDRYRPDYANFSRRDVGKQKVWISKSRRAYHGLGGPLIPVPLSQRGSKSGVSHAFPTRPRRSFVARTSAGRDTNATNVETGTG